MTKFSFDFDINNIMSDMENALQEQLSEIEEDEPMYRPLTASAKRLLKEINEVDNPTDLLQNRLSELEAASQTMEWELRGIIGELCDQKCIAVQWADNTVSIAMILMSLERYEELELTHLQRQQGTVNNYSNSQINNAHNSATINAHQINGIDMAQLRLLIDAVKREIPADTSQEQIEEINENLDVVSEELSKPSPKKSIIKNALTVLQGIVTATEFVAAVVAIAQFVPIVL